MKDFSWLSSHQKCARKVVKIRDVWGYTNRLFHRNLCLEVMYMCLLWWIFNFILYLTILKKGSLVCSNFMDFFNATVCFKSSKEDLSLRSLSIMYGFGIPLVYSKLHASICKSWKLYLCFWLFGWLLQCCIITSFH